MLPKGCHRYKGTKVRDVMYLIGHKSNDVHNVRFFVNVQFPLIWYLINSIRNTVLGHNPPGYVPPRHLPPRHLPPRHLPPGNIPLGHIPPGHIPPGQIPPDQTSLAQTFETERKKRLFTLLQLIFFLQSYLFLFVFLNCYDNYSENTKPNEKKGHRNGCTVNATPKGQFE